MRQPNLTRLADRLEHGHVGAVLGTLDLASGFAGFSAEQGRASVVLVNDVRSPDRAGVQALSMLSRRSAHRASGPPAPPA